MDRAAAVPATEAVAAAAPAVVAAVAAPAAESQSALTAAVEAAVAAPLAVQAGSVPIPSAEVTAAAVDDDWLVEVLRESLSTVI